MSEKNNEKHERNIEEHAEAGYYETAIGSNCSFVERDSNHAAALALSEIQNGEGVALVNAAGEATEALEKLIERQEAPKRKSQETPVQVAKLGKVELQLKASLEKLNLFPTKRDLERAFRTATENDHTEVSRRQLTKAFLFLSASASVDSASAQVDADFLAHFQEEGLASHLKTLGVSDYFSLTEESLLDAWMQARDKSNKRLRKAFDTVRNTLEDAVGLGQLWASETRSPQKETDKEEPEEEPGVELEIAKATLGLLISGMPTKKELEEAYITANAKRMPASERDKLDRAFFELVARQRNVRANSAPSRK